MKKFLKDLFNPRQQILVRFKTNLGKVLYELQLDYVPTPGSTFIINHQCYGIIEFKITNAVYQCDGMEVVLFGDVLTYCKTRPDLSMVTSIDFSEFDTEIEGQPELSRAIKKVPQLIQIAEMFFDMHTNKNSLTFQIVSNTLNDISNGNTI